MEQSRAESREAQTREEDRLSPTEINQGPITAPEKKQGLSDPELKSRLEAYSRVNTNVDPYQRVGQILNKYSDELESRQMDRTKQDIHYGMGERAGLPQGDFQSIQETRDQMDQALRDEIAKEAKEVYRDSNSLSNEFKENPSLEKVSISYDFRVQVKGEICRSREDVDPEIGR